MDICILMGSPRRRGNTQQLLEPFCRELTAAGVNWTETWLCDKNIHPCTACRTCQQDWTVFGCRFHDDAQEIFDAILACDLLLLATPIYSWYCTPPMKALLDRLAYGMNKYYGETKGPSLWRGKGLALLSTCGYPVEKGTNLWESGMRRYAKHSQLKYLGMLAEHDPGYTATFMTEEKAEHARQFARQLLSM